jgi:hypothetical protein
MLGTYLTAIDERGPNGATMSAYFISRKGRQHNERGY